MDDKKQESQKTVVAFVAGLLIGGLLVWVFTASPDGGEPDPATNDDTDTSLEDQVDFETGDEDDTDADGDAATDANGNGDSTPANGGSVSDDVSFSVRDQAAGTTVVLGDVPYPNGQGWIVVHESANGELDNALGAARYDTSAGLAPNRVQLLRGTVAGETYAVVYYTENGDRVFDLREDVPMTTAGGARIEATFTAQ